jgi:hypothetical protein
MYWTVQGIAAVIKELPERRRAARAPSLLSVDIVHSRVYPKAGSKEKVKEARRSRTDQVWNEHGHQRVRKNNEQKSN